MKPDVIVVGGGCAGLAAATAAAERGARVRLLESRAVLGGRSRSWVDPESGDVEDNGQHVLMGCYDEFLAFVRRTGAEGEIDFESGNEVVLLEPGGNARAIPLAALTDPVRLLYRLFRLGGPSLVRLGRLRRIFLEVRAGGPPRGVSTVAAWLASHGQGSTARRLLWDPLTLATLNLAPEAACASLLAEVLRRVDRGGADGARIGYPRHGLTPLVVEPAVRYLEERGGETVSGSPAVELEVAPDGKRLAAVKTRDGSRHEAGGFVLAVPPEAAARLLAGTGTTFAAEDAARLGASPIVAVHLWFDREVADHRMAGLLDSPVHWIFDRARIGGARPPGYLALVTSAAREIVDQDAGNIVSIALDELKRFVPKARSATLLRSRVLKERTATPALGPDVIALRPGPETSLPNLALAGDWTDTGLPATLEGAALSGHRAAKGVKS